MIQQYTVEDFFTNTPKFAGDNKLIHKIKKMDKFGGKQDWIECPTESTKKYIEMLEKDENVICVSLTEQITFRYNFNFHKV